MWFARMQDMSLRQVDNDKARQQAAVHDRAQTSTHYESEDDSEREEVNVT